MGGWKMERNEFLAGLLETAIEHGGYGFPLVLEWHHPTGRPNEWYAKIQDGHRTTDRTWRVSIGTIADGLRIIRESVIKPDGRGDAVSHSRDTGERLFFDGFARENLIAADDSDGEQGAYDVVGALAVLQCALFGRVIYN